MAMEEIRKLSDKYSGVVEMLKIDKSRFDHKLRTIKERLFDMMSREAYKNLDLVQAMDIYDSFVTDARVKDNEIIQSLEEYFVKIQSALSVLQPIQEVETLLTENIMLRNELESIKTRIYVLEKREKGIVTPFKQQERPNDKHNVPVRRSQPQVVRSAERTEYPAESDTTDEDNVSEEDGEEEEEADSDKETEEKELEMTHEHYVMRYIIKQNPDMREGDIILKWMGMTKGSPESADRVYKELKEVGNIK